jgi:GPH family glycoside/pentoside/hexuronide:cation symporter
MGRPLTSLKRWQEPIYALGSLGSNLLGSVVLEWVLFYYRPSEAEAARTGAPFLVGAATASAVWIVARVIDGVCDLPIASWTDNLRSRWGRRRPMMALGLAPMAAAFLLVWHPPLPRQHWLNAAWMALFSSAFFFSYTFVVVPYLALLSDVVEDEQRRLRIASWQAALGALGMATAAVAGPGLFERLGYRATAWLLVVPGVLCFLGPILVVREPHLDGDAPREQVPASLWRSVAGTLRNRAFAVYMLSTATFFLGLQILITGQPYFVTAVMGLNKGRAGVLNLGVFGSLPLALPALNRASRRRGTRWAYRLAILVLGIVALLYPLTWTQLRLPVPPLAVALALSVAAGYPAAASLALLNALPAEIAHHERLRTGENRAGMYFAVQGVINQGMAALAGVLVVQLTTHLGSTVGHPYGALALTPLAALLCFAGWALLAPSRRARTEPEQRSRARHTPNDRNAS